MHLPLCTSTHTCTIRSWQSRCSVGVRVQVLNILNPETLTQAAFRLCLVDLLRIYMTEGLELGFDGTGDFVNDLNDDVADFEPEACQGLAGWRDFYFKVMGECEGGARMTGSYDAKLPVCSYCYTVGSSVKLRVPHSVVLPCMHKLLDNEHA